MSNETSASSMGPVLFVGLTALALVSQGQEEIEFANPAVTMEAFDFADPPADASHSLLFVGPSPVAAVRPGPAREARAGIAAGAGPDDALPAPGPAALPRAQDSAPRTSQPLQIRDDASVNVPQPDMPRDRGTSAPPRAAAAEQAGTGAPAQPAGAPLRPEVQQNAITRALSGPQGRSTDVTRPEPDQVTVPPAPPHAGDAGLKTGPQPDRRPALTPGPQEPRLDPNSPTRRFLARDAWNAPATPRRLTLLPRPGLAREPRAARPDRMSVIADPSARNAVVNGDFVNLRTQPGNSGEKIDQFNSGKEAVVTQTIGNWARVVIDGQTGWMYLRYLTLD